MAWNRARPYYASSTQWSNTTDTEYDLAITEGSQNFNPAGYSYLNITMGAGGCGSNENTAPTGSDIHLPERIHNLHTPAQPCPTTTTSVATTIPTWTSTVYHAQHCRANGGTKTSKWSPTSAKRATFTAARPSDTDNTLGLGKRNESQCAAAATCAPDDRRRRQRRHRRPPARYARYRNLSRQVDRL